MKITIHKASAVGRVIDDLTIFHELMRAKIELDFMNNPFLLCFVLFAMHLLSLQHKKMIFSEKNKRKKRKRKKRKRERKKENNKNKNPKITKTSRSKKKKIYFNNIMII